MLKIGNVQLKTNVMLAPIAGHCDLAFRLTVRRLGGAGIAFTDLLCPHGILKQNKQTQWLMATNDEDRPLGMQLYGQDPHLMTEAAKWSVDHGATTLDINMGCPVDKVTKTFAGSMMLCTPDHTVKLAKTLVDTVGHQVPVTAKTRLGYYENERTAKDLVKQLIDVGIQCITIHGRTAHQRFKGFVNYDGIAEVVHAVHEAGNNQIPCIGNGDIRTPFDAQRMINATHCDGVMIARETLQAPWLIRDTAHLLQHGQLPPELTLRQRVEVIRMHFHELLKLREERFTINKLRQKIGGYSKYLNGAKSLKQGIINLTDPEQFDPVLDQFLEENAHRADEVPVTWQQRDQIFIEKRERAMQTVAG